MRHDDGRAWLRLGRPAQAVLAANALVLLLGLVLAPQRNWAGLLLVGYLLITLGLAGAFFRALQYATGGPWHPAIRALPLTLASLLPVGAVIVALVLVLRPSLWPWQAGLEGSAFKLLWLSRPFFGARAALYLLLWLFGAHHLAGRMNATRGAFWTVVFGLTAPLAAFDWIMSLEPHWYSTLFGAYNVAGMVIAGLAALIVLAATQHHRVVLDSGYRQHDAATMLMALCGFWMYLWFSQYMLIWYANIPEETAYYVHRLDGAWQPLFVLNLLLNGALPFLVLMPREAKQSPAVLLRVAWVVLAGRWLDLYLMITPGAVPGPPAIGLWEANLALAAGLLAVGVLRRRVED